MHYFRSKFIQENGEKQHFSAKILTLIIFFTQMYHHLSLFY